MKSKMAHMMAVFLCDHCSAVHVGMWRNGEMFAEAIPMDPDAFAADLLATIAESKARSAGGAAPVIAHKH